LLGLKKGKQVMDLFKNYQEPEPQPTEEIAPLKVNVAS